MNEIESNNIMLIVIWVVLYVMKHPPLLVELTTKTPDQCLDAVI